MARDPLPARRDIWSLAKEKRERILAFTLYTAVALGPFLILLIKSVLHLSRGNWRLIGLAIPTGRRSGLLLNSLATALPVAILATLLGWVVAAVLWSRNRAATPALVWLALPLAAVPPYVHALTWFSLLTRIEQPLRAAGFSLAVFHGGLGYFWVGIATYAPLGLAIAWLGLRTVDPLLVDAGRSVRPDMESILHIAAPLSAPAVLAAGGAIFLLNLLDYSVPSLFQVNVYAMETFAEFSASGDEVKALLLTLPLVLLSGAVTALLLGPVRSLATRHVQRRRRLSTALRLPGWANILGAVALILLVVQSLAPLVFLGLDAGPLGRVRGHLASARAEILYSLNTAALAALISLPLAFAAARALARVESIWLWWMILLPAALPAALVGVSFIPITSMPFVDRMPTSLPVAFVHVVRYLPLAVVLLASQLRRSDPGLYDAARVFQASALRRFFLVSLPLRFPGFLAAAGLVFALSLGELGATLMVVPPGSATLTMRIYNYLHYGASSIVSGLSLALVAAVALATLIAVSGAALWGRLHSPPRRST